MSHLCCMKCKSNEHFAGYGFAAGGLGAYTICECGEVLEYEPDDQDTDTEGQNDDAD